MITQASAAGTVAAQGACCRASALEDADATFCIECGEPLLRCMAFEECGGIVDESGLCPVCVRPQFHIVTGALMKAAVGGSVVVPFELINASSINRPLFIKRLWSREKGDWREERLGWEKLSPGERKSASATAFELTTHGEHQIEIMWEVATQWLTREEHFAFSTAVRLAIPPPSDEAASNIQISSANQMNGTIIQIHGAEKKDGEEGRTTMEIAMRLERQDKLEREMGMRGLDGETLMLRSARFRMIGFDPSQVVSNDKPIVTSDAMLHFGRSELRGKGGLADAQLVIQAADGGIDREATIQLSRGHFDIFVENARPILRVASRNGLRVNGKAFGQDKLVQLSDGDVISPLAQDPEAIKISVRFRHELNKISAVELTRSPAWQERAA